MKYLLDTHTFLWCITQSSNLPHKVRQAIQNPTNEVFVSAVTFWEISIKSRLHKIDLGGLPQEDLIPLAEKMDFQCIELTPEEANTYCQLSEETHKDPFDRMLIWQSIKRKMTLISKDVQFDKFKIHGLKVLWH